MVNGADTPGTLELARVYRAARYRIDASQPLFLRLDEPNPGLSRFSPDGSLSGVFLTACNPYSRCLRPAVNARRLRALQRAIGWLGHGWLPGCALDPLETWPEEPSVWVPGMPAGTGHALARRFGQNDFIVCDALGVPRLAWVQRHRA